MGVGTDGIHVPRRACALRHDTLGFLSPVEKRWPDPRFVRLVKRLQAHLTQIGSVVDPEGLGLRDATAPSIVCTKSASQRGYPQRRIIYIVDEQENGLGC